MFDTLLSICCMTGIITALVNLLYNLLFIAVSSVAVLSLHPSDDITLE